MPRNTRTIPEATRTALVNVMADACDEDSTLLAELLRELCRRSLTPYDLVAPLVMGPWVPVDVDCSVRYLGSLGGTGPHAAMECERNPDLTWSVYYCHNNTRTSVAENLVSQDAARIAGDTQALADGWLLA